MNILKKHQSVLWLLKSNNAACENIWKTAEKGIDRNRIIFAERLPHYDHLKRMRMQIYFLIHSLIMLIQQLVIR